MSIGPSAARASRTTRSMSASFDMSPGTAVTGVPVSLEISPATCSSRSLSRAVIATFTPASDSSRAVARPLPRLPPVISAVLPFIPRSIGFLLIEVKRGRIVGQDGLRRCWPGPLDELREQLCIVRRRSLEQRVRPVAAPQEAIGPDFGERVEQRAHVFVGWPGIGQAIPAADLGPAMIGLSKQADQRLESR